MPRQAETGTTDEPDPSRCASPYCGARLAPGAHALTVSATWLPDTKATLCGWGCLAAWVQLMVITKRARDNGDKVACQRPEAETAPRHDGCAEATE